MGKKDKKVKKKGAEKTAEKTEKKLKQKTKKELAVKGRVMWISNLSQCLLDTNISVLN